MACSQTLNGIIKDCLANRGGIVEAYIANFADVESTAVTGGKITAIAMAGTAKFHRYQFRKETGSLSSNYTIDQATGANYVVSDLVLVFNRMETTKRVEIAALALGELAVIVKDGNGAYWYLGREEGVTASAGDGLTGTARGDRNGYSITLQDVSSEMPLEVFVDGGDSGVDLDAIVA